MAKIAVDPVVVDACIEIAADRARVPQEARSAFLNLMRRAVTAAWQAVDDRLQPVRPRDVRKYFSKLRTALEAMKFSPEKQSGSLADINREAAGIYLAAIIAPVKIEDWIAAVDRAECAATNIKETHLPTVKSNGNKPGFTILVHQLFFATRSCGGELMSIRGGKSPAVKGTFIDALDALSACLPSNLIPISDHALQDSFDEARRCFESGAR